MKTNENIDLRANDNVQAERERALFAPPTDILENESGFELRIDLPAADPTSIDVQFEQGVLTVRAKTTPTGREGFTTSHAEFDLGDFERRFRVNESVDSNGIEASYKLGVLRVRVPKVKPARRRIEVAAS